VTKLLLVCPCNDDNARIAASWALAAIENTEYKVDVEVVVGPHLTRRVLEEAASSRNIVLDYGHGDWSRLMAEVDLLDEENVPLMGGMVICAIACRSGRDLGVNATTRAGVQAYLGFSHNVLFLDPDPGGVFRSAFAAAAESMVEGRAIEDTARALRTGIDRILD